MLCRKRFSLNNNIASVPIVIPIENLVIKVNHLVSNARFITTSNKCRCSTNNLICRSCNKTTMDRNQLDASFNNKYNTSSSHTSKTKAQLQHKLLYSLWRNSLSSRLNSFKNFAELADLVKSKFPSNMPSLIHRDMKWKGERHLCLTWTKLWYIASFLWHKYRLVVLEVKQTSKWTLLLKEDPSKSLCLSDLECNSSFKS